MDRLAVPLLLPLAVTIVVVALIALIGQSLLFIEHDFGSGVAAAVALVGAGAILVGCALAARGGPRDHAVRH